MPIGLEGIQNRQWVVDFDCWTKGFDTTEGLWILSFGSWI